jgi:hypothetical protein
MSKGPRFGPAGRSDGLGRLGGVAAGQPVLRAGGGTRGPAWMTMLRQPRTCFITELGVTRKPAMANTTCRWKRPGHDDN